MKLQDDLGKRLKSEEAGLGKQLKSGEAGPI
jgi:hypothetical protein